MTALCWRNSLVAGTLSIWRVSRTRSRPGVKNGDFYSLLRTLPVMIRTPTTLILGAGASVHLGFPTGNGLKQIICDNLGNSGSDGFAQLQEIVGRLGETQGITRFRDTLARSGTRSIDTFLERRRDLMRIGKLAIAQA